MSSLVFSLYWNPEDLHEAIPHPPSWMYLPVKVRTTGQKQKLLLPCPLVEAANQKCNHYLGWVFFPQMIQSQKSSTDMTRAWCSADSRCGEDDNHDWPPEHL